MQSDAVAHNIEDIVNQFLVNEPDYFLIEVKLKPTNNIKVFIDGDKGLSIEKCSQFNRQLYKIIDEKKIFPSGDFSLEVSSPGVDKPLKMHRQYQKNTGRFIEVLFNDDSLKKGRLLQVSKDDIILEETTGKGKKMQITQLVIPFSNIKTTTVQTEF